MSLFNSEKFSSLITSFKTYQSLSLFTFIVLFFVYVSGYVIWVPILFVVLLLRFFAIKSIIVILFLGLLLFSFHNSWFILYSGNFYRAYSFISSGFNLEFNQNDLISFSILIITLIIFFAGFKIINFFFNNYFLKIFVSFFFLYIVFHLSKIFLDSNKSFAIYFVLSSFIISKLFVFFLYSFKKTDFSIGFLGYSQQIFPSFWDLSAIPRNSMDLNNWQTNRYNYDRTAARIAFKGLVYYIIAKLVATFTWQNTFLGKNFDFGYEPLPILMYSGFDYPLVANIPRFSVYLSVIASGVYFIFGVLSLGLFFDAFYRVLGFVGPMHFENFYRAKSFGSFFSSIMPYYVQYLNTLFIIPIEKALKKYINHNRIRYDISLFLGLIIGGFIFHFYWDLHLIYQYDFLDLVKIQIGNSLLYFGSIFLLIKIFKFRFNNLKFYQLVMVSCFWIFLYSFVLTFRYFFFATDIQTRINFYLYILGIM
jgi:hypothetical protein